jgi:hypothetical protein
MPEILMHLASKIACEISVEIAKKSLPIIEEFVKSTVNKTVEFTDEGWLKDYYAGGISAQFNKNNRESA